MIFKKKNESMSVDKVYVDNILSELEDIYNNKSSDEYKCKGDITKSPNYENIDYNIAKLSSIKGFPEKDITVLKTTFNTLHRPIFHKMVVSYLEKPDEKNIIFTTAFTVGYRLLVGELSRIVASTEATDHGLVYKPGKVERSDMVSFMKKYNSDLDKKLDDAIKRAHIELKKTVQESATLEAIGAGAGAVVGVIESVFGFINNIFKSAASLNPISLISAVLSRSYDKKVEKYEKICKEYEAAQKAYDEYKKIPVTQRKQRIEHKYTKMIEKYNIKMGNLKAQIDHYDLRAMNDAKDAGNKKTGTSKAPEKKEDNKLPKSSSTVDTTNSKDDGKDDDDMDF